MKITTLDAWDRLQHFKSHDHQIGECCQNLIDQRPFGERSFYIFAHTRTDDDGVTKRLIWQPRLTRPKPQTNSMLFKWIKGTDNIKVCWMIPDRAMWRQYNKGNVTESNIVGWSIDQFENHREQLAANDPDDPSDAEINRIYREISDEAKRKKSKLIHAVAF